jgi:predicted phosphodiesterase
MLVGDIHGKTGRFKKEIYNKYPEESFIQVGDWGFKKAWNSLEDFADPERLQIVSGNHDDPNAYTKSSFWLGNFGIVKFNGLSFFFIRGGISIDRVYREAQYINGNSDKTWWSTEELSFREMLLCMELYEKAKPDVLITHAAPTPIKNKIVGKNRTNDIVRKFGFELNWDENTGLLIDECIKMHTPKMHAFGHLHKSFDKEVDGCRYICLKELEALKI